ncbi:hypothetical protein QYF61_023718 [Mycteria americana]|uniref:Uncharacterized protein n=1 Tax=Mycteria americana TaxID=33587 RepID=A0AAN7MJ38_MYCAM|nr:hypothetical protein QYF61_023718 [Mycteria americana]
MLNVKKKRDMRGFTAGGTTEYRTDTTRSRDGEEMERGFRGVLKICWQCAAEHRENRAPGSCCDFGTSSTSQEGPIVQGFADGNVAVAIGHGLGDSGGDGAQVEEGEVEQEEVHGGVEAVVAGYGSNDEAVAQEGSQVDAQEEPEVQELQLPRVCKHQQEELSNGVVVGHFLPVGLGTCPRRKRQCNCRTQALLLDWRSSCQGVYSRPALRGLGHEAVLERRPQACSREVV